MFVSGIADEAGKAIDVQIQAHQEIGLKHIEIRNVDSVNLTDVPDAKFDEIYDKVNAAGLTVSCFASQLCNWGRPVTNDFDVDVQELKRAIPRMHKFNCTFIRCMSYPNNRENPLPEDDWKKEVFRRMKELAKIAEDGGVTLVHENCDGYGGKGPDQTLELLAAVGSDNLKLVFDTGNTVFHGQDSYDFYSKVQDHVIYIHIKDGKPQDGKTVATYPGEGNGAVREICKAHLAKDPDVGFSIEPHLAAAVHLGKEADDEQAYNIYVEYGKRMVALLNDLK
ncbi:MAG: sugar phosphate isomerase/epimerase [Planctomycetes bacterium]|nr:sugar phosphate isomerase/epimerase [Planctomycetota bacterium]